MFRYLAVLAAVVCAMPLTAQAQSYPTRTVTIVVPFAAGSGSGAVFIR